MKKLTIALTLFAVVTTGSSVQARNVEVSEAQKAAAYYMSARSGVAEVQAEDLELVYQINNPDLGIPACYFFNVADWGWVIMSANTAIYPIIGHSDRDIQGTLDTSDFPPNMMAWLMEYAGHIFDLQNYEAEHQTTAKQNPNWVSLLNKALKPASKSGQHKLLTKLKYGNPVDITWHQSNPYNLRCPKINGTTCVTGCVATALSQIVYYYEYPKKPKGVKNYTSGSGSTAIPLSIRFDTVTFDYSNMLPSVSSTSSKRYEVAKLCYCVGLCMEITYNTASNGGSGAYSQNVIQYMSNNFKYNRCTQITRDATNGGIGDDEFVSKIRKELKLNRPVYMSGSSSTGHGPDHSGHAWVCGGYDDDDETQYYMNWGWTSGNGWYDLKGNGTGMYIGNDPYGYGYTFNVGQSAMINLVPPHADSTAIDFTDHLVGIAHTTAGSDVAGTAYPSPATHSVTLPYTATTATEAVIYNIEGRVVRTLPIAPNDSKVEVNVSGMPAGTYLYRIGTTSGKFIVR